MKKKCKRTFAGIQFTHVEPGLWLSDDGIELNRSNIGARWDNWSVEHNPRVPDGDAPHGKRSTGFTAVEALQNANLSANCHQQR